MNDITTHLCDNLHLGVGLTFKQLSCTDISGSNKALTLILH